jgi:ABC-2 type transport system permease protein
VTGVLTLLLSVPLGFRLPDPDFGTAAVVLLFSALVFTSMGLLGAAVVLALQQGGQVINLVLAAMGFLGGALFPVDVLPGWLQTISRLSPLTYALQALRGAVLDGLDVVALRGDLLVLLAFAAVLLPLSVLALTQSFNYAQARGTLGRY